ncbi:nitroreductase family deazaflavin-dependent oxidoreductase [Nocardia sp. KC 131]|uniref:nitroreductase family deazaflavin-dependent oxidoreductase n=1 Tax=Nocardia arseniciresistens TaxID=3392119 RepID=UPI00398ED295
MSFETTMQKVFTGLNAAIYRASKGRVGGRMFGAPVLLLHTVGRKTGKERTTPLLYLREGERYIVVASNGGSATDPAWWPNLKAKPETTIQVRGEIISVVAAEVSDQERSELWSKLDAMYSGYAQYRTKTDRQFPTIALTPAGK